MLSPKNLLIVAILVWGFLCNNQKLHAQRLVDDTARQYYPTRLKLVATGAGLFYFGTLSGLYTIWYEDKNQTNFHWFDDNQGWMQVDKFGHAYTSYFMGKLGYRSLMWTGIDRKKAIWYGGSYGFLFLTSVEFLDGHYEEWGASVGDIASNAFGSLLFIGQELAFKKQVITLKFSYHPTDLAEIRPAMLGSGPIEKIIKDYNGQTYWFSANYRSFFKHHNVVPKWINVAGGYAAYGMLGGKENPDYLPYTDRYRRYFLSLDIDFDQIHTRSKVLNSVFFFLNLLKFPLPTLEYNEKGEFAFHPIYF